MKKIIELLKGIQNLLKGKKVYIFALIRLLYSLIYFAEDFDFEILGDAAFQAGLISAIRAAITKTKENK